MIILKLVFRSLKGRCHGNQFLLALSTERIRNNRNHEIASFHSVARVQPVAAFQELVDIPRLCLLYVKFGRGDVRFWRNDPQKTAPVSIYGRCVAAAATEADAAAAEEPDSEVTEAPVAVEDETSELESAEDSDDDDDDEQSETVTDQATRHTDLPTGNASFTSREP